MSKALKSLIRDEVETTLKEVGGGVFVTFAGLDSEAMYKLRSSLNGQGVSMKVIPNRITRSVMEGMDLAGDPIADVLVGDTALIYGETPIVAARAVKGEISAGIGMQWKGGLLEGEVFGPEKAASIAELPTREELLAQISFCFQASAQRIAGCFQQTYKQIAGVHQSLADKLDEGGGEAA